MTDMKEMAELKQTRWGSYEFKKMPSEEELTQYYKEQYHQSRYNNFQIDLEPEEKAFRIFELYTVAKHALNLKPNAKNVFDVGCGEGFLLNEFKKLGLDVKGTDYNTDSIAFFNNTLLKDCIQGDFYTIMEQVFEDKKFDIITSTNVIEHVTNPEKFLKKLISGMYKDSLLILRAPNDFSILQEKLLKEKLVDRQWWVKYPRHISFFPKKSMENFLEAHNLEVISCMADYPIDLFLLNDELNYVQNPEVGRIAHKSRVKVNLFLSELDINKVIKLYEAYADLSLGRNLNYFCRLKG